MKKKIKILAIGNNTGSKYYRLVPQLRHMQNIGHEVRLERHDAAYLDQKIDWCDVLVLQMVFSRELVALAKSKGKKVIFECDDLIHTVPKDHYNYADTKGWKSVKLFWETFRILRKCDGFITTVPRMKRLYGWMCKKSLVFPNYLSLEHWLKENPKNHTKKIRLLFAGSTSHEGDLLWIKPVIKELLEKYKNLQFIYIGTGGVRTNDLYAKFVYGEDLFEGLPNNRESLLPMPSEVWPYVLATLQADIAIAPVRKNYFNSFKSQCKYLEYGLNGIPGVYSRWHYTDVKDGETGLLADTPDEWKSQLEKLINDARLRARIGENAREDVIGNFNINNFITEWQGFVEALL